MPLLDVLMNLPLGLPFAPRICPIARCGHSQARPLTAWRSDTAQCVGL